MSFTFEKYLYKISIISMFQIHALTSFIIVEFQQQLFNIQLLASVLAF